MGKDDDCDDDSAKQMSRREKESQGTKDAKE
jgi:hypothetical protein